MIGQRLILAEIQKRYGEAWAVRETNLQIEPGEFVSIVGPSGSGKTSLLTMVAGFETPTAGTVRIGDRDVTSLPPNRRDIGMVFQKYALFPHLTVRKNIAFPLKMRRALSGPSLDARVDEMLQLVQLSGYGDRYPNQLSGGQQQRVAVARALASDPSIILMDEPLGALDKNLRETMQFELKRIQQQLGATVIYVTHDQDEALTMSDRVAIMRQGELQQIGTPVELYRKPANAFVANFIGTMNFIPGSYAGTEDGKHLVRIAEDVFLRVAGEGLKRSANTRHGTAVNLAIRPEHIRLTPAGQGGDGALSGSVETSIFVGSIHIVLVRPTRLPGLLLRVQTSAAATAGLEQGHHVDIAMDETTLQAFPASEELAA